jgi:hypothetical protein
MIRGANGVLAAKEKRVVRRNFVQKDFFIWIRCNPLKSPDSTKGIQGNASFFACISLDLLAFTLGRRRGTDWRAR